MPIDCQSRDVATLTASPSLRETGVLLAGAIVILLLTASAALMLWRARQESLETWRLYLANFSATAAEHAGQTLHTVDFVLRRVVDRLETGVSDSGQPLSLALGARATHAFLRERVAEVEVLDGVAIVALDGRPLNGSRSFPPVELDLTDRDYFQAHVADPALDVYVSTPARNRVTGQWTVFVSRKLHLPSGQWTGLAVAGIDLAYFEQFYRSINFSDSDRDSVIVLLRRDGTPLVRYPAQPQALSRSYRDAPVMRSLAGALSQGRSSATVYTTVPRVANPADAPPRMAAAHAVAGFPLAVLITATENLMLRNWHEMARFVGAGVLVTDGLIAALMLWIHRLLRRRRVALLQLQAAREVAETARRDIDQTLRACMAFASRVAGSDFTARLEVAEGTEFGSLAASLNRMADALQEGQASDLAQAQELRRLNRALRVLSQANATLVRASSEAALVQDICQHVVDIGGYRLAWVGRACADAGHSLKPVAHAGVDGAYVNGLNLSWGDDTGRQGVGGMAVRQSRAVVVRDIVAEPALAPWRDAALARGLASCIALPLLAKGEVLGALCIYAAEVDAFDNQEIKVLQELAEDLAFGIASLRETEERKHFERELARHAAFDQLTGLANRFTLEARLHQSVADARRHGSKLALLHVNLDRFKLVNDALGQGAGDQLLCTVAQALGASVREADTVARLGGDEFAVLLKDVHSASDVADIVSKLIAAMSRPQNLDGLEIRPSASVGISLFPDDSDDIALVRRHASTAMQHAKSQGGNRYRFFAPEMNVHVAARLAMESDLRRAIDRGELLVHYQPKVSLHTGELTGAEALVRWCHPQRGMVSPAHFIPLAEDTGLIEPLGDWVLAEVCRQLRAWLDDGLHVPPVAVNLSARQFHQSSLLRQVEQALQANALAPRMLGLEITESAVMHDVETAAATVGRLKALGVGVSLDDFGTGYSSLSYLKRFPLDYLKIDRSFVNDITTDPDDAAICKAVIGLAHNLDLRVVAEGVETEAQAQYLRQQQCDELQGYLFSKPVPAGDFAHMVKSGRTLSLAAAVNSLPLGGHRASEG
ncbi:EAL domain-containing protein [uncultured Azohydromonas sp.]|uniref:bifunctional diguanylate cyclase/phosphodiesterase n=1 Tax=uncultured Azohydromonas sp. TaxID=487342 RepID=UPI0026208783|nr:EAL domain-containing protein [uncultured Azohydromonas sp.]